MDAEPTSFLETNALLAVLQDDDAALARPLARMLPGERRALRGACRALIAALDAWPWTEAAAPEKGEEEC